MILRMKHGLTALAVATLPLAGLAATFTIVGADAVYAERGNGNGGGNGGGRSSERGSQASEDRGNGRGGQASDARGNGQGNGRGAIASELKGLNACHASDQARENASADSQVGRIATYATAVQQTETAESEWQTAFGEYKAFEGSYTGPTSGEIQTQIDALNRASPTYAANLTALEAQRTTALTYESKLADLGTVANDKLAVHAAADEQEQTALSNASGGRELSTEAVAALQSCLEG